MNTQVKKTDAPLRPQQWSNETLLRPPVQPWPMTHASYLSHSSSAVVFKAAKACRNISMVSAAQWGCSEKGFYYHWWKVRGRTSKPGDPSTAASTRVNTKLNSSVSVCVSVDLAFTHALVSCVLGPLPTTASISTLATLDVDHVKGAVFLCHLLWDHTESY